MMWAVQDGPPHMFIVSRASMGNCVFEDAHERAVKCHLSVCEGCRAWAEDHGSYWAKWVWVRPSRR